MLAEAPRRKDRLWEHRSSGSRGSRQLATQVSIGSRLDPPSKYDGVGQGNVAHLEPAQFSSRWSAAARLLAAPW